jgi:succinate dehydrogenase / fumarate reductase membrane anchor subunit
MRSPLSRVRGLGSAKEGVEHWWVLRVTAVALVPLVIWYVISLLTLVGAGRDAVLEWLGSPFPAIASVLLIVATFHHAQLGAQVVIEDYVHTPWLKTTLLLINKFAAAVLGATAIFAVLKVAFG